MDIIASAGGEGLASAARIVANLDCEIDWAREDARARAARGEAAPSPRDPRFALPPAVAGAISAYGTLLRVFAGEGDYLWTPEPVAAGRLAPIPGMPIPALESGPLERLPAVKATLAWGETPVVAALRQRGDAAATQGADAARAANHRGLCLEAASRIGCALEGAAMLQGVPQLLDHLAAGSAAGAPGERWVLKAPYSAAGRSRLRGEGRHLEGPSRRRAERLFELFGSLLFEPWMERTADFGCCARIDDSGLHAEPPHVLETDSGGVFRGIVTGPTPEWSAGLLSAESEALAQALAEAAARLCAAGYSGPFTVDCWRFRVRDGSSRFHPLGEINARMSFGLVARAIAARLAAAGAVPRGAAVRLALGRGEDLEHRRAALPAPCVIPLLLPAPDEPSAAWVEIDG